MSSSRIDLERIEQWMLTVVRHPDGLEGGISAARGIIDVDLSSLESLMLPSSNLSGRERLDIYAEMYFVRLVESLAEDYPSVQHALGEDAFDAMAIRYLTAHPSTHYRLTPLGRQLADFIATDKSLSHRDFLAQLAQLERTRGILFDAPHDEPLSKEAAQSIPAEAWGDCFFTMIRALELHRFDYPLKEYIDAVLAGESPEIPATNESHVLIWRYDYLVLRAAITPTQFVILSGLQRGLTLGAALDACVDLPDFDPDALMANLGAWFQEWTSDGLFSAIHK
jgi:hypothetical protein